MTSPTRDNILLYIAFVWLPLLLAHQGLFPSVSGAIASVVPLERLAYISYAHFEADECGAMNDFLTAVGADRMGYGMG
jgi:hypothetical protein